MARDNHRNGVCRTRPCHGSDCRGMPNRARNLAVGASRPVGNSFELFPDAPPKRRRLYVGGQIKMRLFAAKVRENSNHPLFEVSRSAASTVYFRARIFLPQGSFQGGVFSSEVKRADSTTSAGHQETSQWRIDDRVVNLHSSSTLPVWGRRHAQLRRGAFIQAPARTKSCVVQCGSHIVSFLQIGFQALHTLRVSVLPGRNVRSSWCGAIPAARPNEARVSRASPSLPSSARI